MFYFSKFFGIEKKETQGYIVELKQCLLDKSTFVCSSSLSQWNDLSILRKSKYIYSDIYFIKNDSFDESFVYFYMESESDSDCYDYEMTICDNYKAFCEDYIKETEKEVEDTDFYKIRSIACKEKQNGGKQDENRYL